MKNSSNTLSLVRAIGVPNIIEGTSVTTKKSTLLSLAELNKIPLLFLENIEKEKMDEYLNTKLAHYKDKRSRTLEMMGEVANIFNNAEIPYALFKTLKPFSYTPADIDILLYSNKDLAKANNILNENGFKKSSSDSYGSTIFSARHHSNIDLTTKVAVSGFVYLDKEILFKHVGQALVNNFKVQTLNPYADLVVAAAHCMYKEQMYTLSDYYTFVLLSRYYQKAIELIKFTHSSIALDMALKLTYNITLNAFGPNNDLIQKLKIALKIAITKDPIQKARTYELPIKYPPKIIMKSLLKKLAEDPTSRNSLLTATKSSIQPRFAKRLLNHIERKSY